jgi:hypothetical protein
MEAEDQPDATPSPGSWRGGARRPERGGAAAVERLLDSSAGCWQVTTEASLHVLDLDRRRVLRVPGGGVGGMPVAALRRDHAESGLLRVCRCVVGKPMVLLVVVRQDGVPTLRTTTAVRAIRALPEPGR